MKQKKISTIVQKIITFNIRIYTKILKSKKHFEGFLMQNVCKAFEDSKYDVAFRLKERYQSTKNQLTYFDNKKNKTLAIVMQGPLRDKDQFTLNTAKYYLEMYPEIVVIVSTWDDENQQTIETLREIGCEVVVSKKPSYEGHLNINFQLVNSLAGLKKAKELGVTNVAKTRTDQCISKPHVFEFVVNLLEEFPTEKDSQQNRRLITLSMNYGNMFYPYFMSDFFYFGMLDDMIKVFSTPLDTREKFSMPMGSTRREYAKKMYAPEVYILKNYLMSIGYDGDDTVFDYWKAVKECLICLDMKTLDIVWPKYDGKYSMHTFYGDYFEDDSPEKMKTVNFDFVNWFNLYSGSLEYKPEYEKYADVIFK